MFPRKIYCLFILPLVVLLTPFPSVEAAEVIVIDIGNFFTWWDSSPPSDPDGWPYLLADGLSLGWFFDRQDDGAGRTLQLWSIDPDGSFGMGLGVTFDERYGLEYIDEYGNLYWIGQCPYERGINSGEVQFLDVNGNGLWTENVDILVRTRWQSRDGGCDDDRDGLTDESEYIFVVGAPGVLDYFHYEDGLGAPGFFRGGVPPNLFRVLMFRWFTEWTRRVRRGPGRLQAVMT